MGSFGFADLFVGPLKRADSIFSCNLFPAPPSPEPQSVRTKNRTKQETRALVRKVSLQTVTFDSGCGWRERTLLTLPGSRTAKRLLKNENHMVLFARGSEHFVYPSAAPTSSGLNNLQVQSICQLMSAGRAAGRPEHQNTPPAPSGGPRPLKHIILHYELLLKQVGGG